MAADRPVVLPLARRTEVRLDIPASQDGHPLRGFEEPVRGAGFPISGGVREFNRPSCLAIHWFGDVGWAKPIEFAARAA